MAFEIEHNYAKGKTLTAHIRRHDTDRLWNNNTGSFSTSAVYPLASNAEAVTLSPVGSGPEANRYRAETNGDLETFTGIVTIYVVDTGLDETVATWQQHVENGLEVDIEQKIRDDIATVKARVDALPVIGDITTEATASRDAVTASLSDILADTNELQGDWVDGGRLDAILDQANTRIQNNTNAITVVDGRVADILADTDEVQTSLATGGSVRSQLSQIENDVASNTADLSSIAPEVNALATDWADGGRLDLILDNVSSGGGGGTAPTVVQIRQELDANSTQLAAILADTNELQSDWSNGGRLDLLIDALTSGQGAVTTAIAGVQADVTSVLADTNELQADWSNGGRLDLILDQVRSNTASLAGDIADIPEAVETHLAHEFTAVNAGIASARSDIGNVNTAMASVLTSLGTITTNVSSVLDDTNEMQIDLRDGGRIDLLIDSIITNQASATEVSDIKVTLEPGGTIHTLINSIQPVATSISPEHVNSARTWKAESELETARNVITCGVGDDLTLSMDFAMLLNPGVGISSASGAVVVDGDDDLTFGTLAVSQDFKEVHVPTTGMQAGKRYKIRVSCVTIDNDTISRNGILKCAAH